MKVETFFERFDQFADAPNAVSKLRELVLQFAVTGRLVPQHKNDGSASVVIEAANEARARLLAERKIKERFSAPVEDDEKPFTIPSSWEWARLADVGHELGQKVPDKRFSYIDVGSIDSARGKINQRVETLEPNEAPSRARKLVAQGTVVYSTVRPYLRNIAVIDRNFDFEPIASTAFGILHPFAGINNHYLFYWLRSPAFTSYVQEGMKGMAYPAINDEKFYGGFIPLPPLAEQKRIVAKVDQLMVLCDRLEALQQERETRHAPLARAALACFAGAPTPNKLTFLFHKSFTIPPAELGKSILTLAIRGKLVSQDPNDEPAEASFPKLATAAVQFADDGFPGYWLRVPLGNAGEWRGGGTPSKSRPDFWEGDLPWVSPKDMKVLHISDAQDHISETAVEDSSVRVIPSGSLLMVVRGMILARAFPVALTIRDVTINQDMKALMPFEPETKDFLLLALRAFESDILAVIERSSHGTCKLKTEYLQDFVIPFPPLLEQRRIVSKVNQLMALVDQLEAQLMAARSSAAAVLEALVAELTSPEKGAYDEA